MCFFLMSQGSVSRKIRFLGQKVCPVARVHTDRHTDTKVNTEDILSGFQELFIQPIIDRANMKRSNMKRVHIHLCVSAIGIRNFTEF